MWIIDIGTKHHFRVTIYIIVPWRAFQCELENTIGETSPSYENDSVEETEGGRGGDEVDSTGTMLLEVFVFDGEFVVSHGLFSFDCGGCSLCCYYWKKENVVEERVANPTTTNATA